MTSRLKKWAALGIAGAFVFACMSAAVFAQEGEEEAPSLKVGDKAKAFGDMNWVQGEAFDPAKAEGDSIYVVEFWATWCGPCRAAIPHIDAIYDKYKDEGVKVVGISLDDDAATVKEFVEKQEDGMSYAVAYDNDGAATRNYMVAFQKGGIPQAFIVDEEGTIVWEGHPMSGLEEAIEEHRPKKEEDQAKAE